MKTLKGFKIWCERHDKIFFWSYFCVIIFGYAVLFYLTFWQWR